MAIKSQENLVLFCAQLILLKISVNLLKNLVTYRYNELARFFFCNTLTEKAENKSKFKKLPE